MHTQYFVLKQSDKFLSCRLPQTTQFDDLIMKVISLHPFDRNFFWSKFNKDLDIHIVVCTGLKLSENLPSIDDDEFPKIVLRLRVCDYLGKDNPLLDCSNVEDVPRNREQQQRIEKFLYHEIGHIVDKHNPTFNYCRKVRDELIKSNLKSDLDTVWNCYIDGRLTQNGMSPRSFEDRVQESSRNKCTQELLREIWDSRFLTFGELVNKAKTFKNVKKS